MSTEPTQRRKLVVYMIVAAIAAIIVVVAANLFNQTPKRPGQAAPHAIDQSQ